MPIDSQREFAMHLESLGELARIRVPVNPRLEISEITDRMVKQDGPALFFEQTGTQFPLLINAFGSDRRMAAAFGVTRLESVPEELEALMKVFIKAKDAGFAGKLSVVPEMLRMSRWMPRKMRGRGACQEVVMPEPDLDRLPVLTCWPRDGGPFITLPLVHTVDPESGEANTGMYRMQVYDKVTTGMHWHMHKDGASHYRKYRELGRRMPVTVTLGGDPVLTYAATAPLPPFIDENIFAGVIRKRGVKLVKSLTNDIWIPAESDFVIEGYVDPGEPLRMEGPFGDHTGFYSLADLYPVFHVTAITHRRDAVYPTTIVGIPPQEDLWLGKATERIFLMPIRASVAPEITDMRMPAEGVFHNLVLVSVKKTYPGQAQKVASALWGAGQMMFNKILVLFKDDVPLDNSGILLKSIARNVDPAHDLFFLTGPLDVLDHASRSFAFGSKMGVDVANDRNLPECQLPDSHVVEALGAIKGITSVSAEPMETGIPLLLVFADKGLGVSISDIHRKVAEKVRNYNARFIFYLDKEAAGLGLSACLWLMSGNTDPQRDYIKAAFPGGEVIAGFDGTRKTKHHDGFVRDWPNLTTMDGETITLVNTRWQEYSLGNPITSPSELYRLFQQGEGAVAEQTAG